MRLHGDAIKAILLIAGLTVGVLALSLILGPPGNGLSRSRAIAIAQRDARASSVTPPHLEAVRSGHLSDFQPAGGVNEPFDRWVWAVVFTGKYPLNGGPPPGQHLFAHSRLVVIDYRTGEWLMAEEPSPIPLGMRLTDALH